MKVITYSSLLISFNEWHYHLNNHISLCAFLPVLNVLSNMTYTRKTLGDNSFLNLFIYLIYFLRHLWRLHSPVSCSEQGKMQQVAECCVWLGFGYLQWWKLHSPSGQPAPVFDNPQLKINK